MKYVYKVKHKYLKLRPDGSRDIENYFHKAVCEEEGETVYTIKYRLPEEASIVQGWVKILNDQKWQKAAHLSEKLEEYEKEGLYFKPAEDGFFTLDTERTDMADFEMVRFGFTMGEPETKYLLFACTSNNMYYYGSKVLDENFPDIIQTLLHDGVIYKALAPEDKHKRKQRVIAEA